MQLDDFDFELPPDRIAQYPEAERTDSKLMVLDRQSRRVETRPFARIVESFDAGDLLVLNDTRVIPARLLGNKETGGKVELFLVNRLEGPEEVWDCLVKASKSPRVGSRLLFPEGLSAEVLGGSEEPQRRVRFCCEGDFHALLERIGRIPLPPYIKRPDEPLDRDRYQTVFASRAGAVAAPTAGLHFTPTILGALRNRGVEIVPLTLHVGLGTFWPVRESDVRRHRMHGERYHIPEATAAAINRAKGLGRRVFALGTTTTRTLEYALDPEGRVVPGAGISDLFIYPGFRFRVVDGLITNFHLPKSTLLMLVSAFAGKEFILEAYRQAVREKFRFFSYGDCMLIG